MSEYRSLLREYRAGTAPADERVRRLHEGARRPPRRAPWFVAGGAVAVAAALFLGLRAPRAVPLGADEVAVTRDVHVQPDGEGRARVDGERVDIDWTHGALTVEVEPERGVRLAVHTDEATVRVIGTAFTVTRDTFGTSVAVAHGLVETDCAFGGPTVLVAGESRTCLPRTAAGALGRIRALQARGLSADAALTELDAALGRPDATGVAANELAALRVGTLLALGRDPEALVAAERALVETPGARDGELRRVAARLHVAAGDCAAAHPHLVALDDAGILGEDAALDALCRSEAP